MSWAVECADVLAWAAEYDGPKFHAVLCDPPYHLTNPNGHKSGAVVEGTPHWRVNKGGFMGKHWDGGDIAFDPATWAAIAEHLHPGGFIMAFGGSRTYHRLACAVEDAGLIIYPALVWLNGQGFPKATRIDTQIDKVGGNLQAWRKFAAAYDEAVKESTFTHSDIDRHLGIKASSCYWVRTDERGGLPPRHHWEKVRDLLELDGRLEQSYDEAEREVIGVNKPKPSSGIYGEFEGNDITTPATPLAATWQGHRYGLQALKPCAEFILVAQKPYEGKPVECIVETGAGALWIDGGRVGVIGNDQNHRKPSNTVWGSSDNDVCYGKGLSGRPTENLNTQGRWPPNVCLTHAEGCKRVGTRRVKGTHTGSSMNAGWQTNYVGGKAKDKGIEPTRYQDPDGLETVEAWECVEGCPVAEIGEQSGERRSAEYATSISDRGETSPRSGFIIGNQSAGWGYYDRGTAARFYPNHDWQYEIAERLAGVTPFRYQAKAGRKERDAGLEGANGKHQADINKIQGNEIYRTRCIVCNASLPNNTAEHCGKKPERSRENNVKVRNPHPTVKPVKLCQWLATLLLPPPEYAPRRIWVPFMGSGSEMIGCGLAGWEEIIGVEMEEEYCQIADARLTHWLESVQMEMGI